MPFFLSEPTIETNVVANTRGGGNTSRQLLPDTGAFADWSSASNPSSSTAATIRAIAGPDDLSLGFNAGPSPAASALPTWLPTTSSAANRTLNYAAAAAAAAAASLPPEMSMFVVAPAGAYHTHTHHHLHHHESSLNLSADQLGVGVGVIPLLTAAPVLPHPGTGNDVDDIQDLLSSRGHHSNNTSKLNIGGGVHHFWQSQASNPSTSLYAANKSVALGNTSDNALMPQGGNNSGGSSGTATCQDCGNQAKKDCSHNRCRTCCKSRGFDCTTHVKSTWVPAARRRERQLIGTGSGGGGTVSSGSTSHGVKKPRLIGSQGATTSHTSTSNNTATPPRSFDTGSSHQDASFKESLPGQVRAPAVFKCVRVTAMDDGEDEYAYQAVVKIGGHVFKGFLYDQGAVDHQTRDGFPNMSELHLGGGGRSGQRSQMMDPADVYGAGGGGILGGSGYGNPMN